MQGGGEHCMYPGEGPGYGHCETQPLHHPPCMEQAWPASQHYSCSYAGGPAVFKSEFCSMEIPLSHYHHQPEYFPEIKPDFSHLQWIQGAHRKGMAWGLLYFWCTLSFELSTVLWLDCVRLICFLVISDDSSSINESMMSGIFKLNLISANPRLKASCGGRSVSGTWCI